MNDPQDSAIERVEPPESADSDLSDEALDRPQGGAKLSAGITAKTSSVCLSGRPAR